MWYGEGVPEGVEVVETVEIALLHSLHVYKCKSIRLE